MEKFHVLKDINGNMISGKISIIPEFVGEYDLEELREHLSEEIDRFTRHNELIPEECRTCVQPIISINGVEIQSESLEVQLVGGGTAWIRLASPVIPFRWIEKYAMPHPTSSLVWLPVQVFKGPNGCGFKGIGAMHISLSADDERQKKINQSYGRDDETYRDTVVSIIIENNLVTA